MPGPDIWETPIRNAPDGHVFLESRFLFWKDRADFYPSLDRIELVNTGILKRQAATGRYDEAVIQIEPAPMPTPARVSGLDYIAEFVLILRELRFTLGRPMDEKAYLQKLLTAIGREISVKRCF